MARKPFPDCPLHRDLTVWQGCVWEREQVLDVSPDGRQQRSLYHCTTCGTRKEKIEKGGT